MYIIVKKQPWWLTGGITATPIAVWQPKGAASYTASKTNLAGGSYSITGDYGSPSWDEPDCFL